MRFTHFLATTSSLLSNSKDLTGMVARVPSRAPVPTCALPEPWQMHASDDGKSYFFNAESKESMWQLPASVLPPPWTQHLNEQGVAYFYNAETTESVWDIPESELRPLLSLPPTPSVPPPPSPPPTQTAAAPATAPAAASAATPAAASAATPAAASAAAPTAAPATAPAAVPKALSAAELQARLLTLIQRIPERGADALFAEPPPWELAEVLEAVAALEPLDPTGRDGWMYSAAFEDSGGGGGGGSKCTWVLRFTSSRTFHLNEGLLGYACRTPSAATPELRLQLNAPRDGWLRLEEPIVRADADAAKPGDSCVATCTWSAVAGTSVAAGLDVLKVRLEQMLCALMNAPHALNGFPRNAHPTCAHVPIRLRRRRWRLRGASGRRATRMRAMRSTWLLRRPGTCPGPRTRASHSVAACCTRLAAASALHSVAAPPCTLLTAAARVHGVVVVVPGAC